MEAGAEEVLILALVAVEDVDVYWACDATDRAVGTQLPEGQFYVGAILAIAGYPDIIAFFDVLRILHVLADKHLIDVKDRSLAGALLYDLQELTDALHEYGIATDMLDLGVAGFDVKDWGQVVRAYDGVFQEMACLFGN